MSALAHTIDRALVAAATSDDVAYWDVVKELRSFPHRELFERIVLLAGDGGPRVRALVPDVLRGARRVASRTIPFLKDMLAAASPPEMVTIGFALGELDREDARAHLRGLSSHASADVRRMVASVLAGDESEPGVATLICLSRDADSGTSSATRSARCTSKPHASSAGR